MNKQQLIDFEEDICQIYNSGSIKAPVHLDNGNEDQLIEIFKNIKKTDWVLGTWRMHYKCLLHGVPQDVLKQDILDRKSINLCYPQYKILSSAIVGGIFSIGIGIALANKLKNSRDIVWIFCGEMSAETGSFYESLKYATGNKLNVKFVIENNFKSVCTPTFDTWGLNESTFKNHPNVIYFEYSSKYPHAGGGKRINF